MPEVLTNTIRIPVSTGHEGHKLRTIDIEASQGISALYCVDDKAIKTYIFDKQKWTIETAQKWADSHKQKSKSLKTNFSFDFIITKSADRDMCIEGYFATPELDRQNEMVEPTAFKTSMEEFFKQGAPILFHHQGVDKETGELRPQDIVGKGIDYKIDDNGVWIKAKILSKTVWDKIKAGALKTFSWSGKALDYYSTVVKGEIITVLTNVDLWEVTLTPKPANNTAEFAISKALEDITKEEHMSQKAEDNQKPYGNVEYADPGYQKDKQKRYPIDNEQHVRAAWSYIHKPENRTLYSEDQIKNIESRIIAAGKKYNINFNEKETSMPKKELKKKDAEEETKEEEKKETEETEEKDSKKKEDESKKDEKKDDEKETEEKEKEEEKKEEEEDKEDKGEITVSKSAVGEIKSLYSELGKKIDAISGGKVAEKSIGNSEVKELRDEVKSLKELLLDIPNKSGLHPIIEKFAQMNKEKSVEEKAQEEENMAGAELVHMVKGK